MLHFCRFGGCSGQVAIQPEIVSPGHDLIDFLEIFDRIRYLEFGSYPSTSEHSGDSNEVLYSMVCAQFPSIWERFGAF